MPANITVAVVLDNANPTNICDALRKLELSFKETGIKVTAAAAAVSGTLSRSNPQALCVASTIVLTPPAAHIRSVRVTAGAAAAGHRNVTDVGGTPAATLATISDDGATLTFEAGVTGAVVSYIPRLSVTELAALFAPVS